MIETARKIILELKHAVEAENKSDIKLTLDAIDMLEINWRTLPDDLAEEADNLMTEAYEILTGDRS